MATDFDTCVAEGGRVETVHGPGDFAGVGYLNGGERASYCVIGEGSRQERQTFYDEPKRRKVYYLEVALAAMTVAQQNALRAALTDNHVGGGLAWEEDIAGVKARIKVAEIPGEGDTLSRIQGQPWLLGTWGDDQAVDEEGNPTRRPIPDSKREEWDGPTWRSDVAEGRGRG
jgi:hypothetical protein